MKNRQGDPPCYREKRFADMPPWSTGWPWRNTGKLPFPDPAASRVDGLERTLDYPPHGSVAEYRAEAGVAPESERLSDASTGEDQDGGSDPKERP